MTIERRRQLYGEGLGDSAIARITGEKRNTITVWRRANGLPSNVAPQNPGSDGLARRMVMYQLGWGDRHIAREEGLHQSSVQCWREARGLRANFPHGSNERWRKRPTFADLAARVRRAIGRRLPPDIVDDAAMDMIRDILDGTIPIGEIEAMARRYGNRVLDRFASRYGPRSLDEEIGDDDGFRMIDLVRDERSSSWLEEMGATVW
jgi:hypothetical protein